MKTKYSKKHVSNQNFTKEKKYQDQDDKESSLKQSVFYEMFFCLFLIEEVISFSI